MLKQNTRNKVNNISLQYGLSQTITEPTHYTESSESLIDVFLVSSKGNVCLTGVGEPFLDQNVRYHCPIFCCFNYDKQTLPSFKRKVWQYDRGDYGALREQASQIRWDTLFNPDIDTYTANIKLTQSFAYQKTLYQTKL